MKRHASFLNWVVNKRFRGAVSETDIKAAFTKIQNNRNLSAEILFPLTAKTADRERRTADMIRHDLDAARKKWIAEAETEDEQAEREQSDFLCYCNSKGKYADFHGLRHTFISNLGKAGVSPKTAQVLARHSTIELTMQVYTHIDEAAQV